MDKKEIWLPVVGYEGLYEISNLGNIKGLDRIVKGRIKGYYKKLKGIYMTQFMVEGYMKVSLSKNGVYKHRSIHRLLCKSFLPNPENKKEINHKNGIRNDNRLENLEWCTRSENQLHSFHTLGQRTVAKIIGQYTLNGKFISEHNSGASIQKKLGYKSSNITACCRGDKHYNTAYGYKWKFL